MGSPLVVFEHWSYIKINLQIILSSGELVSTSGVTKTLSGLTIENQRHYVRIWSK